MVPSIYVITADKSIRSALTKLKKAALENMPTVTLLRVVAKAVVTDEVVSAQMAWNLRVVDMVEQTNIAIPTI